MIFEFAARSLIADGWFVCLDPATEFANSAFASNRAATFLRTQHPTAKRTCSGKESTADAGVITVGLLSRDGHAKELRNE